jgi:AGCS family alanine or glycine:cation symporter
MTQINTIAVNMHDTFSVPAYISGIVLMIVAGLVIIGGLKRIASVTEKLVPAMVTMYILGTLTMCIVNIDKAGDVFAAIFRGAFGMKAAAGGIVGAGVKMAVQMGMKRGVFSNEAGLGSAVIVNSSSNVKEPVHQGMWGIFEVFTDTIVVCTLTAFSVLSSGLIDLETGRTVPGIENTGSLVGMAFGEFFGKAGNMFIAIALLMFAFSTVLGWSHYGAKAMEYLFGERSVIVYKILFVIAVFSGAVMGENLAWELSDTFNGLMMLPNLIGVIVLSPEVYRCTRNYVDRHMRHKDTEPFLSMHDDIQKEQAAALARGEGADE